MRILIVEDEQQLAQGLAHHGYATDVLHDGEEALTRISLHRDDYDLMILDLMIPSMSGEEVCKEARAIGVSTPILILTARAETEHKVQVLLTGADDYLVKPFSFEELVARIHALLRRPPENVHTVLTVGDIALNSHERTVTRDGEPITLTLKEFGILEHLMRRPNEVVNREELLAHLWDFNYAGFSNVVDVHVKNLRKKLSDNNQEDVIETVRGIGYRIRS